MTDLPKAFADSNKAIVKAFSQRLNALLDTAGYPRQYSGRYTQLANRYGVSVQTSRKWCKGLGIPSPAVLLAMAEDFSNSVDTLLNGEGLPVECSGHELMCVPTFELSKTSSGTRNTDFAKCGMVVLSRLPFVTYPQGDKLAMVTNWEDFGDPGARIGDVLLLGLGCVSVADHATYIVRTESMTTIRTATVALSNEVRLTRMGRSRLLEETVIPMKDLLFDESADFTAPGAPNRYLILARVLGFFRSP